MRVTAIFRERMSAASAAVLLLALGGCSSVSSMLPESMTPSSSSSTFSTAPAAPAAQAAAANQGIRDASDFECPSVTVRTGTSTLIVTDKTKGEAADSPLSLKYQGSIVNTARECKYAAGIVTMKVGIEGRIITGPAGGPGQVDVPLRIAVVHEGPQPKVVLSKLARLSVAVTDGSAGATFTHIDPEISFPMPRPAGDIDSYIVYVGYDQQALEPAKKPKAPARKRR
jgi:hypothetical protein